MPGEVWCLMVSLSRRVACLSTLRSCCCGWRYVSFLDEAKLQREDGFIRSTDRPRDHGLVPRPLERHRKEGFAFAEHRAWGAEIIDLNGDEHGIVCQGVGASRIVVVPAPESTALFQHQHAGTFPPKGAVELQSPNTIKGHRVASSSIGGFRSRRPYGRKAGVTSPGDTEVYPDLMRSLKHARIQHPFVRLQQVNVCIFGTSVKETR